MRTSSLSLTLLFGLLLFGTISIGQVTCTQATLITNGSMDGEIGDLVTADGWTPNLTPDLNDHLHPVQTTAGYTWTGTPIESFDGGTWQNLYGPETISQSIACTIGQWYELKFHYAAQGIGDGGVIFSEPVGIQVLMDEVIVLTTEDDQTQYTWEQVSFFFQATTSEILLTLATTQPNQYVGLDGVCVIPTSEPTNVNEEDPSVQLELNAFSDPTSQSVVINGLPEEQVQIQLINLNGKKVFESASTGNFQQIINTAGLAKGMYIIHVATQTMTWTEKVNIH